MLYVKGVCRENNSYDIEIIHQYIVEIWILIRFSLHEIIGRVSASLHLQRAHISCSSDNIFEVMAIVLGRDFE